MTWFKQQRYSNIVDGKVISESSFLLQASASKGTIFDNKCRKEVQPLPQTFLLGDTFTTYADKELVSVLLASVEDGPFQEITFSKLSSGALLFLICVEPNVKVFMGNKDMRNKKRIINRETGEVDDIEYADELEKAVNQHVDFLKEVNYLVTQMYRAVAEGATPEELGCTEEALIEAKSQLLGNKPQKKSRKDFYKK